MTAASDHEIETSHQPIAAEDNEHGQQAPRFKQKHRIMLLFVIAVQVGMLGFDFVLSRKQQQQSSASAPSSMTSPDTKQQRLLFNPKNDEQEYRLTAQNNGKGHVRENRNKPQENKLLRELMPKSTKAPSIDSKAPSIKATKAPSVKESKAPSIKATKAPSIKSTKSGDEPSASAAPTGTPTSSPTTIEGATTADFETTDASGEIEI